MNVDLTAKLKGFDEFILLYEEGDEKKLFGGESLLFYAVSNSNPEERYRITDFLLDKGMGADVTDSDGNNLLHVLLSRTSHDFGQTEELCRRLIDRGANVNQINRDGDVPLRWLVNMGDYDETPILPIFDIMCSRRPVIVNHRNRWGLTPIELAEKFGNRTRLVERMRKYE